MDGTQEKPGTSPAGVIARASETRQLRQPNARRLWQCSALVGSWRAAWCWTLRQELCRLSTAQQEGRAMVKRRRRRQGRQGRHCGRGSCVCGRRALGMVDWWFAWKHRVAAGPTPHHSEPGHADWLPTEPLHAIRLRPPPVTTASPRPTAVAPLLALKPIGCSNPDLAGRPVALARHSTRPWASRGHHYRPSHARCTVSAARCVLRRSIDPDADADADADRQGRDPRGWVRRAGTAPWSSSTVRRRCLDRVSIVPGLRKFHPGLTQHR